MQETSDKIYNQMKTRYSRQLNEEHRKEKLDKQRFQEEARALGYSIKLLRQCLGMTQTEMADKLGMSRTAYAGIESGKVKIRREAAIVLQKLAQRFAAPQYFLWIPMSLYELRVNLGLTREEVAEHLGINAGTWARWETGKSAPVDRQAVLKELGKLAGATIKRRMSQLARSDHVF